MKRVSALLAALFFLILAGCGGGGSASSSGGPGSVSVRYVGAQPMRYYEVVMNYNGDSEYHMGQLYGQALISRSSSLEAGYAAYFVGLSNYATLMTRVQQIKNQIPGEYREFLNGLASQFKGETNDPNDGKLSPDEVFYFSLVGSVNRGSQCSAIAVYGTASVTGKSIIGRLFDWTGNATTAVFYINKGHRSIMSIGNLMDHSMVTGLNKDGIFVALLDSSTGEVFPASLDTYYSYAFDLRYALDNFSTIEAVAGYMQHNKYTFNHLVVIGDRNTVQVLENDLTGNRTLREAGSELNPGITWGFTDAVGAVNAFLLKNNYDNFSTNSFNTYRWQSIKDQLNFYLVDDNKISVNEMKKITTFYGTDIIQLNDGVIMNTSTQHIVVYDSSAPALYVFFRNNRGIGSANTETTFDVNNPEFLNIPVQF